MSLNKKIGQREAGNPLDERLEAIKNILIGDQFEKIDTKFGTLNKRIEGTNSRLVSIVEEVSQEMVHLKEAIDNQPTPVDKTQEKEIEALQEELSLLKAELEKQRSLNNTHQQHITKHGKWQDKADKRLSRQEKEQKEARSAHQEEMNKLREKFAKLHQEEAGARKSLESNLQSRIATEQQKAQAERQKLEHRLTQKLEDVPEKVEARLNAMDEQLEGSFTRLESELAQKLQSFKAEITDERNERSSFQKEERTEREAMQEEVESHLLNFNKLMERKMQDIEAQAQEQERHVRGAETRTNQRMDKVEKRLGGIHDLLEEEVFHYFEDLKKYRSDMKLQMQDMQDEFRQMLEKTQYKMEARAEAMFEINAKQINKISHKVDRKKDLRTTLKKLNDLLEDD